MKSSLVYEIFRTVLKKFAKEKKYFLEILIVLILNFPLKYIQKMHKRVNKTSIILHFIRFFSVTNAIENN